jgi:DNA-binding MarR family transcriptional regulator
MDASAMTAVSDLLEALGLAERTVDADDRRRQAVRKAAGAERLRAFDAALERQVDQCHLFARRLTG